MADENDEQKKKELTDEQRAQALAEASAAAEELEASITPSPMLTSIGQPPLGIPYTAGPMATSTPIAPPPAPAPSAPLSLPISSGRMYMGPSLTPDQEEAFLASAPRTSQVLVPPAAEPGAAARIAAATAPPTISAAAGAPSPTSIYPEMRQFYAQQQIRNAVASGMPMDEAVQTYGSEFFTRAGSKPMTEFQRAQVAHWAQPKLPSPMQVAQMDRWKKQMTPQDANEDRSLLAEERENRKNYTLAEALPVEKRLETQRKLLDERASIAKRRAKLAAKYEQTSTLDTGSTGGYTVGARYGNLRYKGGNPNDASSWERI